MKKEEEIMKFKEKKEGKKPGCSLLYSAKANARLRRTSLSESVRSRSSTTSCESAFLRNFASL